MRQALMRVLPALAGIAALSTPALADMPRPWEMYFQQAASPVMHRLRDFHDMLLVLTTLITLFVLGLLVYVMWRFSATRNPTPSRTTHNTVVEVLWTVVPVIILVVIAIPSFKILYYMDKAPDAKMTLKAIGHQWYWEYQYPDANNMGFDSTIVADKDIKPGQQRLLEVDNRVVLPVGVDIRILMTAADVLHAWAIPAFGVKKDAVPGRINETWVNIEREGVYYGQCSELCGTGHGYMPIVVEAVSQAKFDEWVKTKKAELGVDKSRDVAAAAPATR